VGIVLVAFGVGILTGVVLLTLLSLIVMSSREAEGEEGRGPWHLGKE